MKMSSSTIFILKYLIPGRSVGMVTSQAILADMRTKRPQLHLRKGQSMEFRLVG